MTTRGDIRDHSRWHYNVLTIAISSYVVLSVVLLGGQPGGYSQQSGPISLSR